MPSRTNFSLADMVLFIYYWIYPLLTLAGFAAFVGGFYPKLDFPIAMLGFTVVFFCRYFYVVIGFAHHILLRLNRNEPDLVVCRNSLFYGWLFIMICGLVPRIVVYIWPENFDILYLAFYLSNRLIDIIHTSFCTNEKEYCLVPYDWNDPIPSAFLLVFVCGHLRYLPKDTYWTIAVFQFYFTGIAAAAAVECLQVLRGNIRLVKYRPQHL